ARPRASKEPPWPGIKRRSSPEGKPDVTEWARAPPTGVGSAGPGRRKGLRLWKNPALGVGAVDAVESDAHGGDAPVALLRRGVLAHLEVRALHALGQPFLHLFQLPALRALVLQPLVVADHHAARVGEDVGNDVDVLLPQDRLRRGLGGAVGA